MRPRPDLAMASPDSAIDIRFWVAQQGADIVPLIGMSRRSRIGETLAAAAVTLTAEDLAEIDRVIPAGAAAGER